MSAEHLLIVMVAVAAGLGVAAATRHGAGASTDSISYLLSAATLRAEQRPLVLGDHGELVQLKRFPPMYPVLLATTSTVAESVAGAARFTGALLLLANVLLAGFVAGRYRPGAGAAAALFAAAALPLVEPHAWIWSEPLFIAAMLTLALATSLWARDGRSWALPLAMFAGAVLVLTRYAGVPIVAGSALAVLSPGSGRSLRGRLAAAASITLAALLPLTAWLVVNGGTGGGMAGRSLSFHPPGMPDMLSLASTVVRWIAPVVPPVAVPVLLALAGLAFWAAAQNRGDRAPFAESRLKAWQRPRRYLAEGSSIEGVLLLMSAFYLPFIVFSRLFLDPAIPFDDRILLPVFVSLIIVGARFGSNLYSSARSRPMCRALLAAAGVLLALHALQTASFLARVHNDGLGYTARVWRASPGVEWVRAHGVSHRIYSNFADVLTFQTGNIAAWLPWKTDVNGAIPGPEYRTALHEIGNRLIEGDARVVYFRKARELMPDSSEIAGLPGVTVVEVLPDAIVFGGGDRDR